MSSVVQRVCFGLIVALASNGCRPKPMASKPQGKVVSPAHDDQLVTGDAAPGGSNPPPVNPATGGSVTDGSTPDARSIESTSSAPTSPVDVADWSFVPSHGWPDRFAYVDPRATIEQDGNDVTATVAPPLAPLLLVYRHRMVGDFRMELDVLVRPSPLATNGAIPSGAIPNGAIRNAVPPGFPGPFGSGGPMPGAIPPGAIPPDMNANPSAQVQFGFLPAGGKSRLPLLSVHPLPLPPQPVERKLVVERQGNHVSYDWDGRSIAQTLPAGTDGGYFVWQVNASDKITVRRVVVQGTSTGLGFVRPDLTRVAMAQSNWLLVDQRARISPREIVRLVFQQGTEDSGGAMNIVGTGRSGDAAVRFEKLLDGDLYATAKVTVSVVAPGLPNMPPTASRAAVTPIKWQLMDPAMKRPTSGTVAIPLGTDYARVTIARVDGEVWMVCDGVRRASGKSEGPVFAGLRTRVPGPRLALEDVQIFAEKVGEAPQVEPPALAAGGWQADQDAAAWRTVAEDQIQVVEDDGKVRIQTTNRGSPVPVIRRVDQSADFQASLTVTQPPLEFFADSPATDFSAPGSRSPRNRLSLELQAAAGSAMVSADIPPPVAGKPTDHVIRIRRRDNVVSITSGGKTKWGTIAGSVQLNLRLYGRNHCWLSPLNVGPLEPPAGVAVPEGLDLPAAVDDMVLAGRGRYLLLHFKSLNKLALVDIRKQEITRFLPANDSTLFAGGPEYFVVLDATSREFSRYRIDPFKLEQTVSLAGAGTPVDLATSPALAGPVVMVATDESTRASFQAFDLTSLRPLDIQFPRNESRPWRREGFLYAAGDGRSFSVSPDCAHFTLSRRPVEIHRMGRSMLLPGPLGKYVFTERNVYDVQHTQVDAGQPERWANVPAIEGPLFVSVEPDAYRTSRSPQTAAVKLRLPKHGEPLTSFDDLRLPNDATRLTAGQIPLARRLFFVPGDGLIVMLDANNTRLWMQRFDLQEILEHAEGEYFFVNSQPPAAIGAGEEYSYALDVRASAGPVTYEIISSPDGMKIDHAGVVRWEAPADSPSFEDQVILTLQTSENKRRFYTFPVRVNGKAEPRAEESGVAESGADKPDVAKPDVAKPDVAKPGTDKPDRVASRVQTRPGPAKKPLPSGEDPDPSRKTSEPNAQPKRVTDTSPADTPDAPTAAVQTDELKLPTAISDAVLGGSGNLLLLHFAELRKIGCFDFRQRRIVRYLPVPDSDVKLAAGARQLVLYLPDSHVLSRYDLATFQRELTVPVSDSISALAMGYASNGPLWVVLSAGYDGRGRLFDVSQLKAKDVRYRRVYNGRTFPGKDSFETGPRIRVSANGRVLCGTRSGVSPTGVFVAMLTGDTVDARSAHESWGLLRPGPHGDIIYTARGPITKELKRLRDGFEEYTFRVHAIEGHYHLQLRQKSHLRREPAALTLHFRDDDRVLKSFAADRMGLTDLPTHPVSFSQAEVDKRIFFHPQEKLLVTVDTAGTRLLLTTIDIDRVLDESGIDYLFVKSRPPTAVRPGADFRYALDVCSKNGGVEIRLESGPEGMRLKGDQLRWTAPETEESHVVLLSIRDASGQEIFHKFQLAVSSQATELAVDVRPVPPEDPPRATPAAPTSPAPAPLPEAPAAHAAALLKPKAVKLPDTVGDICVGANGRVLIAHLPALRQLALFDLRQHRVVKYVSLSGAEIKFAAGREKLFVYVGESHTLSRYDLTTFQRELTQPVNKKITAMAMGHSADGPLWVVAHDRHRSVGRVYDPRSLKPVDYAVKGGRPANGNGGFEAGTLLDVSADGKTLGSTRVGLSPSGFYLATLDGETINVFYGHESMGRIRPGRRGEVIFTHRAAVGRDMQPINSVVGLPIHAVAGDYYLNVKRASSFRRDPDNHTKVSFYHVNSTLPLATMRADELGADDYTDRRLHDHEYERRMFFNADENVLATLKADRQTLQVTPLDITQLLEDSGIDYLFVTSRPPPSVRPGGKLKYKMTVRSKRGGTRFQLESGPDGMSLADDELTWVVPRDYTGNAATVLVAVRDDSGQEIFHKFSVAVKTDSGRRAVVPPKAATPTPATPEPTAPAPQQAKHTVPLHQMDALRGGSGQKMTAKEIGARYAKSVVIVADRRSTGSGFVVGRTGLVLTCAHCARSTGVKIVTRIDSAAEPIVRPAQLVYRDDKRDIALLKFKPEAPLHPVRLAPAVPVALGERVTVIANPGLGNAVLSHTLTQGVVSNARRDTGTQKLIQTTAAINPGSSGGPMFDEYGLVIGMVTAKANIEATGFAISAIDLTRLLLLCANTTGENAALERTWVDVTGKSVAATYVDSDAQTVGLSRNGKTLKAPIDRLGEGDQAFLQLIEATRN